MEIKDRDSNLRSIEKKLGNLHKDAPLVLKLAINETARKTKNLMIKETQKNYVMKASEIKRRVELKRATVKKPKAVISSKGRPTNIIDHRVSPLKIKGGKKRNPVLKGKVLKKSGMKSLEKSGLKAFLMEFVNSHKIGVVRRIGKGRKPLKTYYSPAIPQMLGNKNIMEIVRPQAGEMLQKEIARQIDRRIRKEMYVN